MKTILDHTLDHTEYCICGHEYYRHYHFRKYQLISTKCDLCDCSNFECPACVEESKK